MGEMRSFYDQCSTLEDVLALHLRRKCSSSLKYVNTAMLLLPVDSCHVDGPSV